MEIAALGEDSKALRGIARSLIAAASEGKMDAIKEIGDRMDGKPAQAIENGDDGPLEVLHRIERVIVRPANKNG
jgi:hypothetical protein